MSDRRGTPGAGLGQTLEDAIEELNVEDDQATWRECKHCGASMCRCPACKGSTFQELTAIAGGGDNTKYGEYRCRLCEWCSGTGFCSVSKAERWRLQQPSDAPPAPK